MLKGMFFCITANFLFGLGYYFAILLRPLNGESMFGFRIIVLIPFILLAILLFKQIQNFKQLWQKNKRQSTAYLYFIITCTKHRCTTLAFYVGS